MGKVQNEVTNCSPPWRETTLWEDEVEEEKWSAIGDATWGGVPETKRQRAMRAIIWLQCRARRWRALTRIALGINK